MKLPVRLQHLLLMMKKGDSSSLLVIAHANEAFKESQKLFDERFIKEP